MVIDIKELAKKLGVTDRHVRYILDRKRRPSAEIAVKLEEITNIPREAWIWPEKFGNTLIELYAKVKNPNRKVA